MFWSLDLDDFTGDYCLKNPYPLLSAVYSAIELMAQTTPRFTGSTTSMTTKDFRLHHRTSKDGINVCDMDDPDNHASSVNCHWTLTVLSVIFALKYFGILV